MASNKFIQQTLRQMYSANEVLSRSLDVNSLLEILRNNPRLESKGVKQELAREMLTEKFRE